MACKKQIFTSLCKTAVRLNLYTAGGIPLTSQYYLVIWRSGRILGRQIFYTGDSGPTFRVQTPETTINRERQCENVPEREGAKTAF